MSILVTGSAGFIGFHVAKTMLEQGKRVIGIDNINDYYSPSLKWDRNSILGDYEDFKFYHKDLCDLQVLKKIFDENDIEKICHLAAQAGVRYSIKNPHAYERSNLKGFTNILEIARNYDMKHLVFASSSSVYGGNKKIPYSEEDDITRPVSYYAATKVANEVMAHSYSHLYNINCTGLRFFTVYGPWGRPDMAMFKFTDRIVRNQPIDVYNYGDMKRDFTYISDIVNGVISSIYTPFEYEIFNLGNNTPVNLMEFIGMLEDALGKKAKKNLLPMQPGDMKVTYADITKAKKKLDFDPKTDLKEGIKKFVKWYREYYQI